MAGTPIGRQAWTRDEAISALQAFGKRHGRAPTSLELKRSGEYKIPHERTLSRLFGGVKAALDAAGLPPRPRGMHATTGTPTTLRYERPAKRVLADPSPLTPLSHQWYEASRVVEFVLNHYPRQGVHSMLLMSGEGLARRWSGIANGEQAYLSLPVVDKLLTVLDLHIWLLGDPDVISGNAPRGPAQLRLEQEAA